MSHLADSCEYLTVEKQCNAVLESAKASANRQLQCQNQEKESCCYLCASKPSCTVRCQYLGAVNSQSSTVEERKTQQATAQPQTPENRTQNASADYCFLCNAEMSQTKTTLSIDGWKGSHPKHVGDTSLPVTVYLCPQCGRIELKADLKPEESSQK